MRIILDAVLVLAVGLAIGAGPARAQETPFDDVACIMTAPPGQIPEAQIYAVDSEAEVWAMFCGGTAGYVSDLSLASPGVQYIGTGNVTASGSVVDLGVMAAGSELVFMIYVRNTGYTYYSGPGSRNPDGMVHAAVTDLGGGYWLIGFEDLYGGGDADYDDINVMLFAEVVVQPPCSEAGGDADGDGICGDVDNCPAVANTDQADADGDGTGDACDACPADADDDADGDGVCGDEDLCPDVADPGQLDGDGDGLGDACDACPSDAANDVDDDGVCADDDNCDDTANPDQIDLDGDGIGDACDTCVDADDDGVCGDVDRCPATELPDEVPTLRLGTNRFADTDGDGIFETTGPSGRGPRKTYTVASTGGCSCAQIIVALQLGEGHVKYGCSISAMDDWIALGSGGGQLE